MKNKSYYKLSDDEKAIADGFRELINWEEIGFECMGSFYSGAEAISFFEGFILIWAP